MSPRAVYLRIMNVLDANCVKLIDTVNHMIMNVVSEWHLQNMRGKLSTIENNIKKVIFVNSVFCCRLIIYSS